MKNENSALACDVCGDIPRDGNGIWPPGPVYHCKGLSRAFGAKLVGGYHHSRVPLHQPCMVCGADLGCVRCSGPTYELLCMAQVPANARDPHPNAHWGHKAALEKHGRLLLDPVERRIAMAAVHKAVERISR